MKQLFRSFFVKTLAQAKAFPTALTERGELRSLLRTLRPLRTDKTLIRLGPNGDGGYLIPNDLADIQACFSPGVSSESGFEKDCADLGIKVYLADRSVNRPAIEHELFNFTKKFIGAVSNHDFMTLDRWVSSSLHELDSELLLQMDIEGHEYEVLASAPKTLLNRFRIIIVEFHQLHHLWSKPFFSLARPVFAKILETHSCVHIHPNNCCGLIKNRGLHIPKVMEFTFLRKDRIVRSSYENIFPNPLDCDNTSNHSITLPQCWYNPG